MKQSVPQLRVWGGDKGLGLACPPLDNQVGQALESLSRRAGKVDSSSLLVRQGRCSVVVWAAHDGKRYESQPCVSERQGNQGKVDGRGRGICEWLDGVQAQCKMPLIALTWLA